jgi:hypothetical protein
MSRSKIMRMAEQCFGLQTLHNETSQSDECDPDKCSCKVDLPSSETVSTSLKTHVALN